MAIKTGGTVKKTTESTAGGTTSRLATVEFPGPPVETIIYTDIDERHFDRLEEAGLHGKTVDVESDDPTTTNPATASGVVSVGVNH